MTSKGVFALLGDSIIDNIVYVGNNELSVTEHLEENSDTAIHVCGEKNPYYIEEKRPTNDFSDNSISNYKLSMRSAGAFGNKAY